MTEEGEVAEGQRHPNWCTNCHDWKPGHVWRQQEMRCNDCETALINERFLPSWHQQALLARCVAALTFLRQGEDISVKSDWQPHPSHQMKEWRSTILNFGGSDRFGSIRSCSECGAEEAKGGQSHRADTSLTVECGYDPFAVLAEVRQASGQEVSRE